MSAGYLARSPLIRASHAFGNRQVLKGAWLTCRSGEIVGLLGRNGCGKSTLLQILFGSLKADFRALFLNGHPVERLFRLPDVVAYLPQDSFLPRRLRVRRAIQLFAGPAVLRELSAEPRLSPRVVKPVTAVRETLRGRRRPPAFTLLCRPISGKLVALMLVLH